jgi:restriction system protein
MPIPDYQAIMLPLLRFAGDGKEHTMREGLDALALEFKLTPEEIKQMLPSGAQGTFHNRTAWARSYMGKAGLLESPERGVFVITKRGSKVLSEKTQALSARYLERFPDFVAFRTLYIQAKKWEGNVSRPEIQKFVGALLGGPRRLHCNM